jgi:predicted acyltransferase
MIFVIMVAGYKDLPHTFPAFGSAPVSTWKHAGEDFDPKEWTHWTGNRVYKPGRVLQVLSQGGYDVVVEGGLTNQHSEIFREVAIRHSKPLLQKDDIIAVFPRAGGEPQFQGVGNGCTFTDLIAPFFVLIVGVAIPLSRQHRGAWWRHVGKRTLLLIAAGIIYISLALKGLSWWWGILQAIGIAYFMGASFLLLPAAYRWGALLAVIVSHALLSWYVPWWTHLPADMSRGFFTLSNVHGDKLAPLNVHCTPWGSIGYGILTVIGTFIGEALAKSNHEHVLRRCLSIGIICTGAGYAIHRLLIPMNKDNVSISYSIFTGGVGTLSFLLFYWLIDVKGVELWSRPLTVFGKNPLLGYFLQPLVRILFIQLGLYSFFTSRSGWSGMGWGLLWTFILWCVCLYCNKRSVYWKL